MSYAVGFKYKSLTKIEFKEIYRNIEAKKSHNGE